MTSRSGFTKVTGNTYARPRQFPTNLLVTFPAFGPPSVIDSGMLFRWFIGLNLDNEVWDATVITRNRDQLLEADMGQRVFGAVRPKRFRSIAIEIILGNEASVGHATKLSRFCPPIIARFLPPSFAQC